VSTVKKINSEGRSTSGRQLIRPARKAANSSPIGNRLRAFPAPAVD
jgi:hypothetical protein